jgi:hypothetical protein
MKPVFDQYITVKKPASKTQVRHNAIKAARLCSNLRCYKKKRSLQIRRNHSVGQRMYVARVNRVAGSRTRTAGCASSPLPQPPTHPSDSIYVRCAQQRRRIRHVFALNEDNIQAYSYMHFALRCNAGNMQCRRHATPRARKMC